MVFRDSGNEGHESSTAKKLSDKDGGVALGFSGFDPLQTWPKNTVLTASFSKDSTTIATHSSYFAVILFGYTIKRCSFYINGYQGMNKDEKKETKGTYTFAPRNRNLGRKRGEDIRV